MAYASALQYFECDQTQIMTGHLLVFLMYVHMKGPYNLFWLGGCTPVHLELAGRVHFTLQAPTLDSPISSYFVDDAG